MRTLIALIACMLLSMPLFADPEGLVTPVEESSSAHGFGHDVSKLTKPIIASAKFLGKDFLFILKPIGKTLWIPGKPLAKGCDKIAPVAIPICVTAATGGNYLAGMAAGAGYAELRNATWAHKRPVIAGMYFQEKPSKRSKRKGKSAPREVTREDLEAAGRTLYLEHPYERFTLPPGPIVWTSTSIFNQPEYSGNESMFTTMRLARATAADLGLAGYRFKNEDPGHGAFDALLAPDAILLYTPDPTTGAKIPLYLADCRNGGRQWFNRVIVEMPPPKPEQPTTAKNQPPQPVAPQAPPVKITNIMPQLPPNLNVVLSGWPQVPPETTQNVHTYVHRDKAAQIGGLLRDGGIFLVGMAAETAAVRIPNAMRDDARIAADAQRYSADKNAEAVAWAAANRVPDQVNVTANGVYQPTNTFNPNYSPSNLNSNAFNPNLNQVFSPVVSATANPIVTAIGNGGDAKAYGGNATANSSSNSKVGDVTSNSNSEINNSGNSSSTANANNGGQKNTVTVQPPAPPKPPVTPPPPPKKTPPPKKNPPPPAKCVPVPKPPQNCK